MKLYSGYYSVEPPKSIFKIGVIEAKKDKMYEDSYELDSYYFVSSDYSTRYLTPKYIDIPLKLRNGIVMYSFDKEKIKEWLDKTRNYEMLKAKNLYESLSHSVIEEEF